jgi:hypothetical protein
MKSFGSASVQLLALVLAISATAACGAGAGGGDPTSAGYGEDDDDSAGTSKSLTSAPITDETSPSSASAGTPSPANPKAPLSPEREIAAKLGLPGQFLIGLGNDAEGSADKMTTYALGQKLDIHYMYLSGLEWPTWNTPEGSYVTLQANAAKTRGIVPMFTLYQAASYGENNLGAFATTTFMTKYWRGVRIMFERLGAFDAPAIVHVEPDLWGYAQKKSEDPAGVPMKVGSLVPECKDLPENVAGMARCVIRLSRTLAPKVVIGLSASAFGAFTKGQSDPVRIGTYMKKLGADEADITVLETLDRDAGCFEVGSDANCKRAGSFYWDEANIAHPNFHDHLAWAKTIRTTIGRPLLWWQMPLGVPSSTAGWSSRYRDNRVHYLFTHPAEFAAAGGIGAVFGTGAANQTTAKTDGGQFKTAVTGYYAAPVPLL